MKMDLLELGTQRLRILKVKRLDVRLQVLDRPPKVFAPRLPKASPRSEHRAEREKI